MEEYYKKHVDAYQENLINKDHIREGLLDKAKKFPHKPGIYLFKSKDKVVYVGKSKNLRTRIMSYFRKKHEREKLYMMMDFIDDLEYIETRTHLEARILEFDKIRKLKPIYNAQFKIEKDVFYLKVSERSILEIVKDIDNTNLTIGPFIGSRFLRVFIEEFTNIFPIDYSDQFKFEYQIFQKRLSKKEKDQTLSSITKIFTSQDFYQEFLTKLNEKMIESSKNLQFERALYFKNLTNSLNLIKETSEDKAIFHKSTYVVKENDYYELIDCGQLKFVAKAEDLDQFIGIYNSELGQDEECLSNIEYSQELYSLVYSHSKEKDIEIIKI